MPPKMDFLELTESWGEGYAHVGAPRPGHSKATALRESREARRLMDNELGLDSLRWQLAMRESMGTATFPLAFGGNIERDVRANYSIADPGMLRLAKRRVSGILNGIQSFRFDGLTGRLPVVPIGGEYTSGSMSEDRVTYNILKYGRKAGLTMEAWAQDQLGGFSDIPQRMSDSVINSQNFQMTKLFVDASGPLNTAAANTPLSETNALNLANLETAILEMAGSSYRIPSGEDVDTPMNNRPRILQIPPALEIQAMKLTQADTVVATTTANTPVVDKSVIPQFGLQILVNPWLPIVNTTSGDTQWFLHADPMQIPSSEYGLFQGNEEPQIFMKKSDSVRAGGGDVDEFAGSFGTDSIEFKLRWFFGATILETKASWGSTGAG